MAALWSRKGYNLEAVDTSIALRKQSDLIRLLGDLGSVMVAYSGGVDSSLVAYYAKSQLAERALIVIAVSPSLPKDELEAARAQAHLFDWGLIEIETEEVSKPEYQRNDGMRCYFCKATLFEAMHKLANKHGVTHLAYGANVDDLSDFRPGHIAAREYSVESPLMQVGLSKVEIRYLAHLVGLPSWNRPQAACLSSRFPAFEPITVENLSRIEQAEHFVRSLGFKQIRVRHYFDTASVEVDRIELKRFSEEPHLVTIITKALNDLGYASVVIDKEGYRQGSVNIQGTKNGTTDQGVSGTL